MVPAQCSACRGSNSTPQFPSFPRSPGHTHLFCRPSALLGRLLLIGVGLEMKPWARGGHRGGRCGGCFRLGQGASLSLLHLRIRACLCCHGDQHACIGHMGENVMRERGSKGTTEQSEGDRNHTPRETDGDKWTKSQREGGGGRDRKGGWGESPEK